MAKIELPARLEHLEMMLDFVEREAGSAEFPANRIWKVRLAAEEVLVNIFSYAYPDRSGHVVIICQSEKDAFILRILDRGIPFDVLNASDPDVSLHLPQRQLGGMGIYFVKQMADGMHYERKNGQNRLTLRFQKRSRKLQGKETKCQP